MKVMQKLMKISAIASITSILISPAIAFAQIYPYPPELLSATIAGCNQKINVPGYCECFFQDLQNYMPLEDLITFALQSERNPQTPFPPEFLHTAFRCHRQLESSPTSKIPAIPLQNTPGSPSTLDQEKTQYTCSSSEIAPEFCRCLTSQLEETIEAERFLSFFLSPDDYPDVLLQFSQVWNNCAGQFQPLQRQSSEV